MNNQFKEMLEVYNNKRKQAKTLQERKRIIYLELEFIYNWNLISKKK